MKLWGGRFEKETEDIVHSFSSSLPFDRRLAPYDVKVSEAHAQALEECGVLTAREAESISEALRAIKEELEQGTFPFGEDEDIHSAVERVLVERLGDSGAKLRTARSRNDQVVADLRLYVMDTSIALCQRLASLMEVILEQADRNMEIVMPGFTHLQPAQPVLLSHHLLAYFEMFSRDTERLMAARQQADRCPLGSGALAGVGYALNREMLSEQLGFSSLTANSMDAVSDRDFVADFLYACSLAAVHLSRLAEEMILWSSPAFGFMQLDESYATGSSIMPQKVNPDVAELARGKTGRIVGHMFSLLMMLKGIPLAYNRDLQEDKEGLFEAADQLDGMLMAMAGFLASATFDAGKMSEAAGEGFIVATDLADYLVRKGMPFLKAHQAAGKLVRLCVEKETALEDLPLSDFSKLEPMVGEDVYDHLTPRACVEARDVPGGTAPPRVQSALEEARHWLRERRDHWLSDYLRP
jgi:argininosuccinate lyase